MILGGGWISKIVRRKDLKYYRYCTVPFVQKKFNTSVGVYVCICLENIKDTKVTASQKGNYMIGDKNGKMISSCTLPCFIFFMFLFKKKMIFLTCAYTTYSKIKYDPSTEQTVDLLL